tara:strand:+ start:12514 stop:13128 length:615 start_codon:yes stop_codon:yes gene_type:complete
MGMVKKTLSALYQVIIGGIFTIIIYTLGTFNPNPTILKEVIPAPTFSYTNPTEFVYALRECIDFHNLSLSKEQRIPTQMILAQSILETGWGESRIAKEANNIFGIKSFKKTTKHIHAEKDDDIMYMVFTNKCDSVKYYISTLNNHYAYEQFRKLRSEYLKRGLSPDPHMLIKTLDNYSETDDYEDRLKSVLKTLKRYEPVNPYK